MPPSPTSVAPAIPSSGGPVVRWSGIALFAVLWVDLWRQLSYTWDTNEQYAYGWFVPFLAVALFLRRWPTRPGSGISGQMLEVGNQKAATRGQLSSAREVGGLLHGAAFQHFSISAFVLLLLLLLLPLRVIIEINQDWPLITWPYTIIVVLLTLYAVHLADPSSVLRPPSSPREMSGPAISPGSAFQRFNPQPLASSPPSSAFQRFSVSAFHFSPWVAHFAFPVCFILVAVQWPYRIEKGLTQNLMQIVASLTVEIIGWFGIPAIQRGNLIEISTGVLGVDEACSGIRSFQSTLMAGLFLGELYLLRWPIRLLLVGAGLTAAFLLNVCRTLLLTWQASAHGLSAIDKWHDPAGFTIAIACFGVLWLLAVLIKKRWAVADSEPATINPSDVSSPSSLAREVASPTSLGQSSMVRSPVPPDPKLQTPDPRPQTPDPKPQTPDPALRPPSSVLGPMDSGLRTQDSAPSPQPPVSTFSISAFQHFSFAACRRYLVAVGLWSLLCIIATEVWYRSHEIKDSGSFHWSVNFPENDDTFKQIELPERTRKLIASDSGGGWNWNGDQGDHWTAYFFRWNPTSIASVLRARIHRPERCLPASGLKLVADGGLVTFAAAGFQLPFRQYTYEAEGKVLHVFFCQWEDGSEQQSGMAASSQQGRLQSVLVGRRHLGQQTLEFVVTGPASLEEAAQKLGKQLPALIKSETPAGAASVGR